MTQQTPSRDDAPIRLFQSDFLEWFTHISPVAVLVLFLPMVGFFLWRAFQASPRGRVVACDSRVRYWAFTLAFGGISAAPICLPFFAEEPIRENETHTVSDARCASCPAERKDPAGDAPCG